MGDSTYVRGYRQDFEKLLIRLKGSNIFNDYDLSKKDPKDIDSSTFTTFDSQDNISFGIQGGKLEVNSQISKFQNIGSWTPQNYNPPSQEGWFIYDYNAWSNWIPPYDSSYNQNSGYVIYQFPFVTEPNSGSARTTYEYPIRYNGTVDLRVPLFEQSRWISVKNYSGSTKTECRVIIPKSSFDGLKNINPFTNKPVDIGIYSHRFLISDNLDNTLTLAGSMGVIGSSDVLERLAYKVQESSSTGSTTAKTRDHYVFDINLPASSTWTNSYWFHMAFYWSTHDVSFLTGYPSYSAGSATTFDSSNINTNWYVFPKKNYFINNLNNSVYFSKSGISDTNIYLYSNNKSNNLFIDQRFSDPKIPFRYVLDETIANSANGSTNSFQNIVSVESNEYIPVLITTTNKGLDFDDPNLELSVIIGESIPENFIPNNWYDFDNYPTVPVNQDILFKIILSNSGPNISDISVDNLNGTYSKNNLSICYIEEVAKNVFSPNINDGNIIQFFLPAEFRFSSLVRDLRFDKIFETLSAKGISPGLRYDVTKVQDLNTLSANFIRAHQSVHNLAKLPMDSLLVSESEPVAIQFGIQGSNLFQNFAGKESSKVFLEYMSSSTDIIRTKQIDNTEFEIYQPKTSTELLNNTSGTKLQRDYTFRIKFKNKDSKCVLKDVFVNASKYLLTDTEYSDRKSKNLSLNGYFTASMLSNIDDYRLYGYAAVIPDMESSQGRTISMKETSPVDSTKVSETDFTASLSSSLTLEDITSIKLVFCLHLLFIRQM